MSCTTLYLHRRDGQLLSGFEKYSTVPTGSPDEVRARLDRLYRPLQPSTDPGIGRWACRGVLLDEDNRRFRFYNCYGDPMPALSDEANRRALARNQAWSGWDADIAQAGPFELAALTGLPSQDPPTCEPPALSTLREAVVQPVHTPGQLDPETWTIAYDEAEQWEPAWFEAQGLLSVVDTEGRSRDFCTHQADGLRWLLCGPALVEALEQLQPTDPPMERDTKEGALIDRSSHTLRWWSGELQPVGWATALQAAWPGWTVTREPELYLGQLARAGRDPSPLRMGPEPWLSEAQNALLLRESPALSPVRALEVVFRPSMG